MGGESGKSQYEDGVYVRAEGEIRDRYGRLLAGNEVSYTVNLVAAGNRRKTDQYSGAQSAESAGKNGEKYNDMFPIVVDGNGGFITLYDQEIEDWLTTQNLRTDLTAEEAFEAICEREGGTAVWINMRRRQFFRIPIIFIRRFPSRKWNTQKLELTSFLQSFKLKEDEDDEDLTAEEASRRSGKNMKSMILIRTKTRGRF